MIKKTSEFGLTKNKIKEISKIKNEPLWMLNLRLKAFKNFTNLKNPKWLPGKERIKLNEYIYYEKTDVKETNKWDEIPTKIKKTFEELKVTEDHAKILSGVNDQYNSEVVYHDLIDELKRKRVIFVSMDSAIQQYPSHVKKYFGTLVSANDNKYAALNCAVWSGGSFIYIPKNIKLERPLQAYFRINSKSLGQFERTLIVAEENSMVHYMEGCTAPVYDKNNIHAAVVEIFVKRGAKVRYSTIQNWSDNVLNLVTKRCICEEGGSMEWIDGNIGSGLNSKYPSVILKGNGSSARCVSIATAHKGVIQDTGAKMIHLGENTRSQVIAKSIAHSGGNATYRGLIKIVESAKNSSSEVVCDTLILDSISKSDTIPLEIVKNNSSSLKHEAKVTELDKEKIFYLNSRGIDNLRAKQLIAVGFVQPFLNELPLEYAVEMNRLLKMDISQ